MFSRVAVRNLRAARRFSTAAPTFWNKYDTFTLRRPVLAKCITGGVLAFIADIVTQVGLSDAVSKNKYDEITIDWLRVLKFTAIGGMFVPPILHYWYGFLVARIPGVTISSVLKRLALDQLCFAPVFLPCFISVAMILDGKAADIPDKLKADWFPTVVANYSVWVPCQFINFRFVPPHQQVLFANFVGFFWNMYLSYTCYNSKDRIHAIPAAHPPCEKSSTTVAKDVEVVAEAPVALAKPSDEGAKDIPAEAVVDATPVEAVEAVKAEDNVDKMGFEKVEFIDVEATMPPEVIAKMSDADARGEDVVLDNIEAVVAMSVETAATEVDDSSVSSDSTAAAAAAAKSGDDDAAAAAAQS